MALKLTLWDKKSTANCSQGPKIDSQSPNKLSREETPSKGTVFFFSAEKFKGTHSLVLGVFCFFFGFFFFRPCFFFSRKSLLATHSTEPAKTGKKSQKWYFLSIFSFSDVFFFRAIFFFPKKSFPATHSLVFRGRKKKQRRKKNNSLFTHSIEKSQKGANFKLFREKKIRYLCF